MEFKSDALCVFSYFWVKNEKKRFYGNLICIFRLFSNTYMAVGLDYGTKISHPEPESTTSGLLVSMTQTLGVFFTLLLGWLLRIVGAISAIALMTIILSCGVLITILIPNKKNTFIPVNL